MAPGYLPEAFAINDSCKADGRKRRGPEQLSFIHQGEIARALSYLLVPYHKTAIAVAAVTTVLFSIVFAHSTIFEGRIAVVDLDHSKLSTELIEQINTNSYIRELPVER